MEILVVIYIFMMMVLQCQACSVPMCVECETASVYKCAVCVEGFNLVNDMCAACYVDQCEACDGFNAGTCATCEEHYYLEDNQCKECQMTTRPLRHYNGLYKGLAVFVDYTFGCNGAVTALEFTAEKAGTFYFSSWRPSASGTSWSLLAYNTITSTGSGLQTYTIPVHEQIIVKSSDVFGIFYPSRRTPIVLSSKKVRRSIRNGSSSRFVHSRETIENLTIGVSRSYLANGGNSERIVPLNIIIDPNRDL